MPENMSLTELNHLVRNHEDALNNHRDSIAKSLEGLQITTGIFEDHLKMIQTINTFVGQLAARLEILEAGK